MTLLLTFVVMLLAVGGMALGVVLWGRRLRGSCGGTGGPDCLCDREGRPRDCEAAKRVEQIVSLPRRR